MLNCSWSFLLILLFFFLKLFCLTLHKFCFHKYFIVYFSLTIYLLQAELCICTSNDNTIGNFQMIIVALRVTMIADLNCWLFNLFVLIFLAYGLDWSWILSRFINIKLKYSIITSISFGNRLSIFLEEIDFIKICIHFIFIYHLELYASDLFQFYSTKNQMIKIF